MTDVQTPVRVFDRKALEDRDYWLARLPRGVPAAGPRPDRAPRAGDDGPRARVELGPGAETGAALARLSSGNAFLAYAALAAALKVALRRYADGDTIVIGSPPRGGGGGAPPPPHAPAIVSTVTAETTFRQLLVAARQTLLDAYARQDYPLDRLVREAGGDARLPFDVALSFDGLHGPLAEPRPGIVITARL